MSWWRWARALAWLLVPAWIWATRADVLLAGHPAYAVLVTLAALVGLTLLVTQVRGRRRAPRQPRRGVLRTVGRIVGVSVIDVGVETTDTESEPAEARVTAGGAAAYGRSRTNPISAPMVATTPTIRPTVRSTPRLG